MLRIAPEVKRAIENGQPVVALESTIIAHGMPYPQNVDMAREVERLVREGGAVPATIAIVNGDLRVGLNSDELEHFAKNGPSIPKVSTRDIAYIAASGGTGATTVASTMRLADMAGIRVFATGGIGGAHREGNKTFDVSNDLMEFAISNVAVVTAGAKAILDLALTLEVLETQGVPVVGYGTDDFPAFYSRQSGHRLTMRLDSAQQVANMLHHKWALGLSGGVVIANPIPEKYEISAHEINPVIERALSAARLNGIAGKEVTPYLLKRLAELTSGRSLNANIALVMNNAIVAAEIAKAYSALA